MTTIKCYPSYANNSIDQNGFDSFCREYPNFPRGDEAARQELENALRLICQMLGERPGYFSGERYRQAWEQLVTRHPTWKEAAAPAKVAPKPAAAIPSSDLRPAKPAPSETEGNLLDSLYTPEQRVEREARKAECIEILGEGIHPDQVSDKYRRKLAELQKAKSVVFRDATFIEAVKFARDVYAHKLTLGDAEAEVRQRLLQAHGQKKAEKLMAEHWPEAVKPPLEAQVQAALNDVVAAEVAKESAAPRAAKPGEDAVADFVEEIPTQPVAPLPSSPVSEPVTPTPIDADDFDAELTAELLAAKPEAVKSSRPEPTPVPEPQSVMEAPKPPQPSPEPTPEPEPVSRPGGAKPPENSPPPPKTPGNKRPAPPPLPTASRVLSDIIPLKQWVCWNFQWNGEKWCKVPVAPLTGHNTGHDIKHESDWTDFEIARKGAIEYKCDGVGFVFREGGGLTGIDFDKCLTADGEIKSIEIKTWLLRLDTYTEVSPSGLGLHAICRGTPARTLTKPYEVYNRLRFFTFTGQSWGGIAKPIAERQAVLDEFVAWAEAQVGSAPPKDGPDEITLEQAVGYLDRVCAELCQMRDGRQARATQVCFRLGRIMGGKPSDPRLEFQTVKKRITEALKKTNWPEKKFEVIERQLREGMRDPNPIKITAPLIILKPEELKRPDMPATVLCGYLGEICRTRLADFPVAYAWPSILAAASVLVKPQPGTRCNINVAPVGPVGTGKSEAQRRANYLFALNKQDGLVIDEKFGSAEGMLEVIGDRKGEPVLWSPDELSHLLEKAQIQGASFPFILNTLFYNDRNNLTVQHRKHILFNARVTIAGGIVEENFGNSFGAATTAGLYDRFLFGLCPSGFHYLYRPMEGPPIVEGSRVSEQLPFGGEQDTTLQLPRLNTPTIHSDVWAARDRIHQEEKIEPRILELCIRIAQICAAWDKKTELRASYLEATWELARYQQRVRAVLQPNPGRNFDAMAAYKILTYLKQHADGEKWLAWRDVYRATNVAAFGPGVADRAMNNLFFVRDIDRSSIKSPKGGPEKILIRLAME